MKIAIFAATGGIGRHLLAQAVHAGHEVTVVVRSQQEFPAQVRAVRTDLTLPDEASLRLAIAGSSAVLSALGPRVAADRGVAHRGTLAIIDAMKTTGVRRLIVVSAAPVGTVPSPARPQPPRYDPGDGVFMRHLLGPMIKTVLRHHYADLAAMEDVVRESALDWTIVRPPRLVDTPLTASYRTALGQNLRRGLSISRADVAHLMLGAVDRREMVGQTVGVAY